METFERRPRRALRTAPSLALPALGLPLLGFPLLGLPLLGLAACLLVPPPAQALAAGSHSHTHHASVTPLPTSSFIPTASVPRGKRGKVGVRRSEDAARSRNAGAVNRKGTNRDAKGSSKKRHGRSPNPDTDKDTNKDKDFPTMERTHQRGGRPALTGPRMAALSRKAHAAHEPDPYPLTSAAQRASWKRQFSAMRASAPPLGWRSPTHPAAPSAVAENSFPAHHAIWAPNSPHTASGGENSTSRLHNSVRQQAFAEGVSRPEDDDRLPRDGNPPSEALIGTAEVVTATPSHMQAFTPATPSSPQPGSGTHSQLVQGFGGEVALASPDPGSTHRRSHPLPGATIPGMPPPTLEERDAITDAAITPAVLPDNFDRDGRLLMPNPLRGSREVLVHQNTMATNDGLIRIQNDAQLDRLRAEHELVNFPYTSSLRLNDELPYNRRCARPWTVLFVTDIAGDFFDRFHQPLFLTSAVRTVRYQARLQRVNGNAAATWGEAASPHLTGQAVDLAKSNLSAAEIAWMRAYLLPLMTAGTIDVEEEFQQSCFHISVYRRYASGRNPSRELAQVRSSTSHPQPGASAPDPLQDIP